MEALEAILIAAFGRQVKIGPVVKQYGPFRLHKQAYALRVGLLLKSSRYFVVVGELAVPLSLTIRSARDDPSGYANVVARRRGPFRDCVSVGDIAITRSTHRNLYDHVDRWLKHKKTGIECYAEQLAAASDPSTGNPRREEAYRRYITEMEAEYRIVGDAFREFLLVYPDAAIGTKRTAATDEREARRTRKKFSKGIWFINRVLK